MAAQSFAEIVVGQGSVDSYPQENTPTNKQWPIRTEQAHSLVRLGLGTQSAPWQAGTGQAPTTLWSQSWVKSGFGTDSAAEYSPGMHVEVGICGGLGGTTTAAFISSKLGAAADYTGPAACNAVRAFADASKTSHYDGIVTAVWHAVKSYASRLCGAISQAREVNSFTTFKWDPADPTHYVRDPFDKGNRQCVLGDLMQNYQQWVDTEGGKPGEYQWAFGTAYTSLGPKGTDPAIAPNGRAFGFQTGVYISDCSMEAIRLSGGVYGRVPVSEYYSSSYRTQHGIKFEGAPFSVAAISLGENRINMGGWWGPVDREGDFAYHPGHKRLFIHDGTSARQVLSATQLSVAQGAATHLLRVRFDGAEYDLLARKV